MSCECEEIAVEVLVPGEQGEPGTTFTPAVSVDGVLSWTNDGGRENPQTVDIGGAIIRRTAENVAAAQAAQAGAEAAQAGASAEAGTAAGFAAAAGAQRERAEAAATAAEATELRVAEAETAFEQEAAAATQAFDAHAAQKQAEFTTHAAQLTGAFDANAGVQTQAFDRNAAARSQELEAQAAAAIGEARGFAELAQSHAGTAGAEADRAEIAAEGTDEHAATIGLEKSAKGWARQAATVIPGIQASVDAAIEKVDEVKAKVDEIELYKFPNVDIIGQPLIQSGQVSRFTTSDYLKFPFIVDFKGLPFRIDFSFTTGTGVSSQQNVLDSEFGLAFAILNARFEVAVSTDGAGWLQIGIGTHSVRPDTSYHGRIAWDGAELVFSFSHDGQVYTPDIRMTLTQQPAPKPLFIGGASMLFGMPGHPFGGSINLNRAYLYIGQMKTPVWQGMDDAGLASRADVSLSNIDQAGVDRVLGIVSPSIAANVEAELAARGLAHLDANGAAAHNAIWRGKDLTNVYTIEEISARVQAGTFNDLYIGDYIRKEVTINGHTTTTNWRFIDFDYHINMGDTATSRHHILIMPDNNLAGGDGSQGVSFWLMNDSNTSEGGYAGTKMWNTHMPKIATGIKNAFGSSHILKHREMLTKGVSASAPSAAGAGYTGSANDSAWYDVEVNLPNENMICGGQVFSSSAFDTGERKQQLSAFRLNHALTCNRASWWLSAVVGSKAFALVTYQGDANYNLASTTWVGARPYFLFC